jgi:hypothetical protein
MDSLITGPWALKSDGRFRMIFDEIMNRGDQYFILADFEGYSKACDQDRCPLCQQGEVGPRLHHEYRL